MRYVDKETEAKAKAISNVFFLLAVAFAFTVVSIHFSRLKESQLQQEATTTLSGSMASEVTRHLCVEINSEGYLVVCPE